MTALANNVIQFPKKGPSRPNTPQTLEQVSDTLEIIKVTHVQGTLELLVPMLFDNLATAGFFQPEEDEHHYLKDGALVVEAIRSFLNKTYGMEHPLQLIAEHMFEQVDEDGSIEVSNKVKLVITPTTEGKS